MDRQHNICPICDKNRGADILYGLAAWARIKDDSKTDQLAKNGYCHHLTSLERACTNRGFHWQFKRRKPLAPNKLNPTRPSSFSKPILLPTPVGASIMMHKSISEDQAQFTQSEQQFIGTASFNRHIHVGKEAF